MAVLAIVARIVGQGHPWTVFVSRLPGLPDAPHSKRTCNAGHRAGNVVVYPVHLLSPDAHGVRVQELQGAAAQRGAKSLAWGSALGRAPREQQDALRFRQRREEAYKPTLLVIFFSATSTTPSLARMPMAAPAFEMACSHSVYGAHQARRQPRGSAERTSNMPDRGTCAAHTNMFRCCNRQAAPALASMAYSTW